MKKIIIASIVSAFLLACSFAHADYEEVDCEGLSVTTSEIGHEHCYLDTDTDTDTDTNTHADRDDPAGVGADVVIWQSSNSEALLEEVVTEYRYDANNKEHSVFGVFRINLFKKVKDLLNGDS